MTAVILWAVFLFCLACALMLFVKSAAWSADAVEETQHHRGEWR